MDLQREVRVLRAYTLASSVVLGVISLAAFGRARQNAHFQEIDVERINVREADGTLRLAISNRERSPGPMSHGKPFAYPGGTRPGLIFFNDEGTEDGGLTWGGKTENGTFAAGGMLAFDQYDQDQVLYLQHQDNNGRRRMGLNVMDRADYPITRWVEERDSIMKLPQGPQRDSAMKWLVGPRDGQPLAAERLFAGRDPSKAAVVNLSDPSGNVRVRLMVDSLGKASLDFLDPNGRVTFSLPDSLSGRPSR